MTEEVKEEKKVLEKPKKSIWSSEERKNISNYGCQLLVDDANEDQIQERKLPTDTMIVSYKVKDKIYKDLCLKMVLLSQDY